MTTDRFIADKLRTGAKFFLSYVGESLVHRKSVENMTQSNLKFTA